MTRDVGRRGTGEGLLCGQLQSKASVLQTSRIEGEPDTSGRMIQKERLAGRHRMHKVNDGLALQRAWSAHTEVYGM